MLQDGGDGDPEGLGEAREGSRRLANLFEDCAPGGVARARERRGRRRSCLRQLGVELREQLLPTALPHLGTVGAFEEGSLVGEDEVRALAVRNQFERGEGGGEDAAVRSTCWTPARRACRARCRGTWRGWRGSRRGRAYADPWGSVARSAPPTRKSISKVSAPSAFGEPAAFPRGVGEGSEDALRRHGIVAFENEGVVNHSGLAFS